MEFRRRAAVLPVLLILFVAALAVTSRRKETPPSPIPRRELPPPAPARTEPAVVVPQAPPRPAPPDPESRRLIAAVENAAEEMDRKTALYALAAREPGHPEITRRVCALTSADHPAETRRAAYTALRFRRNDPDAAAALLRAFPGATEPERIAAANSLGYQNLPDVAVSVQAALDREPAPPVRAALQSALAHLRNEIRPEPCLRKP